MQSLRPYFVDQSVEPVFQVSWCRETRTWKIEGPGIEPVRAPRHGLDPMLLQLRWAIRQQASRPSIGHEPQ